MFGKLLSPQQHLYANCLQLSYINDIIRIRKGIYVMSNTATVYARIDPKLKKDVDCILNELNVTPSALIQMLYGQIKLTKGIPFEVKLPTRKPVFVDELSIEDLNIELSKGVEDIKQGNIYSIDDVDERLKKDFGI